MSQQPSPSPPPPTGPGVPPPTSRFGPGLSLLGLALWVATIAAYVLLMPTGVVPGEPMGRSLAIRLVLAFVIAALGVFASAIVSAVGLFLSLSEVRNRPGRRARRGVVLGAIGVGVLALVVAEILRLSIAG